MSSIKYFSLLISLLLLLLVVGVVEVEVEISLAEVGLLLKVVEVLVLL